MSPENANAAAAAGVLVLLLLAGVVGLLVGRTNPTKQYRDGDTDPEATDVRVERRSQVAKGYDAEGDDRAGAYRLARMADGYPHRGVDQGNRQAFIKAAGLLEAAAASFRRLGHPLGTEPSDAEAAGDDSEAVDLRSSGLLWLINTTVFHPRGFALAMDERGQFSLLGDGSEAWVFEEVDAVAAQRTAEATFAASRRGGYGGVGGAP